MRFDDVTGQPDFADVAEAHRAEEKRMIEVGQEFELLLNNGAYQKLEAWLFDQIEAAKEQLIDAQDQDLVRRLQHQARAYSNVIGWVREQIEIGKSLKEAATSPEQRAQREEAA